MILTAIGYVYSDKGNLRLAPKPHPCLGYANGCICHDCIDRVAEPLLAAPQPKQPWEQAA